MTSILIKHLINLQIDIYDSNLHALYLYYIDRFKPNTPIITNISTKAGNAEQNENIHQYKLQSHTSKAKYPMATEAVEWVMIDSSATEDENIVNPERKPTNSMQSSPMATESPAANSISFLSYNPSSFV